jgi:1-deoxy-D-xylulose-5-phosphate synthase
MDLPQEAPIGPLLAKIESGSDVRNLTTPQLTELASEIRDLMEFVCHVSKDATGGHYASGLGVVELTLALFNKFDFTQDRIIWDVGHQVYPHKVLTGRKHRMNTLRQYGGLSGFPNIHESVCDPFTTGHGGMSIATAIGCELGFQKLEKNNRVIAVIGDGSIAEGAVWEGLNFAGHVKNRLLVILNDNEMAIAPTVGATTRYLNKFRTNSLYNEVKREAYKFVDKLPLVGESMHALLDWARGLAKAGVVVPGALFEELGFHYYGPYDGHDLVGLKKALDSLDSVEGPILMHVFTSKGKGRPHSEADPVKWHGLKPAGVHGAEPPEYKNQTKKAFTDAFVEATKKLMAEDKRVVALTAAMPGGTGLDKVAKDFPDRVWDVAMAEQAGVAAGAGLAHVGMKPIVAIYSTFIQRAYDQLFQEISVQNQPVLVCMDRGGLVGADGVTHNGVYDIGYLRPLPNFKLLAPKDARELEQMMRWGFQQNCPVALRFPRTGVPEESSLEPWEDLKLGFGHKLADGKTVALVGYGVMANYALDAREELAKHGVSASAWNGRFAKPIAAEFVERLFAEHDRIVTIEDHVLQGGYGSALLEVASDLGLDTRKIYRLGIPDRHIEHGRRDQLFAEIGIDVPGIVGAVRLLLSSDRPSFSDRHGLSSPPRATGEFAAKV